MWSIPDFTDKCAMCEGISRNRTLQRPPFEVKSVSRCQSVRLRIPLDWASLWTFRTQIRSEAEIFETWLYLWFYIVAKSGIFSFWRVFLQSCFFVYSSHLLTLGIFCVNILCDLVWLLLFRCLKFISSNLYSSYLLLNVVSIRSTYLLSIFRCL